MARIYLDMWVVYTPDGITLEDTKKDEQTGEEYTQLITVPASVMQELQASVKIDITPKGAFDKYAQELSLENLLNAGYFSMERLPELKLYVNSLSDDSVMPKQKLLSIIEEQEEEQRKIAMIKQQAQMMQYRANQFLNSDVDSQAMQIDEASGMSNENVEQVV